MDEKVWPPFCQGCPVLPNCQGSNYEDCSRRDCQGLEPLLKDGDIELLQSIARYESEVITTSNEELGWSWRQVRIWPATLDRFVRNGLLDITFKSDSFTGYKLSNKGHIAIKLNKPTQKRKPLTDEQVVAPDKPLLGCLGCGFKCPKLASEQEFEIEILGQLYGMIDSLDNVSALSLINSRIAVLKNIGR